MSGATTSIFPFEEFAKQNGVRYWDAYELMARLGYESYASFCKVINKAMASCVQLGIQIPEAFIASTTIIDGKPCPSYRLTRFACFLTSLHADGKKPQVAAAKLYFAAIAESIIQKAIESDDLERLEIREELKDGENTLVGVAKRAGIDPAKYGIFKDAGYRGMYNMSLRDLRVRKGVGVDAILYDYMNKTELAANWFRVTQTAERITKNNLRGQPALEQAAKKVGHSVRNTMIANGGTAPENLPITEHINLVKSRLKTANRGMKKLDAKQKALPA